VPGKRLTKKETNAFKAILLKHVAILEGDVASLESDIDSNRNSGGGTSKAPTHPSDISGDMFEQDFTYERLEAEGIEINDVREALDKIEKDVFGLCEMCHEPIPKKRLVVIPYCKFCIACQERIEHRR
jgi:RNA polymerase-binding transcription factor DksA